MSEEETKSCHCGICLKCGKVIPMNYNDQDHKYSHFHKEECYCKNYE